MFSGARLRRLRNERGLTQAALAHTLDLSTSYVNQLENDQRPITVPVLIALTERFDLPAQYFSSDTDARLVADLSDLFTETGAEHGVSGAQIEEFVARMPEIGRSLVTVHRRLRDATEELEGYRSRATAETSQPPEHPMPFEEVRDFFYDRNNYIGDLDVAAEQMFAESGLHPGGLDIQLSELMRDRFGITVVIDGALAETSKRRYDADAKVLRVARRLMPGQRAFQIATQLALLSQADLIAAIVATDHQLSAESRGVARVGLANYFAGAFLLPYREFHQAAEELRYDIDLLGSRFGVGFETVCHRLSTLQRPQQRGVPFIFVRTDKAGNISKRQSATAFHFSQVGGSCPLWVVHEAFAQPGRIAVQVAQMPDGRSYFWVAKTIGPE
ncbi:MAG: short-chain fatty acyl-CoA regulator family protein, partial [Mycobacterium sp.]